MRHDQQTEPSKRKQFDKFMNVTNNKMSSDWITLTKLAVLTL